MGRLLLAFVAHVVATSALTGMLGQAEYGPLARIATAVAYSLVSGALALAIFNHGDPR